MTRAGLDAGCRICRSSGVGDILVILFPPPSPRSPRYDAHIASFAFAQAFGRINRDHDGWIQIWYDNFMSLP
jgi:hypothetical protein